MGKDMNKPVAIVEDWDECVLARFIDYLPEGTALYTHPVKELTDFEIKGVLAQDECWVGEDCSIPDMIAFAKAILRKAQEK